MIREVVKYEDYNGLEREEALYFNLNEAELMEMELTTAGGYAEMIEKIVAAQDGPSIFRIFKDLLLNSYGEKTPDGKGFLKSPELRAKFESSKAYSVIFMKLVTDSDAAAKFINGVIPSDMAKQLADTQAKSEHPALK